MARQGVVGTRVGTRESFSLYTICTLPAGVVDL